MAETVKYNDLFDPDLDKGIVKLQADVDKLYESFKRITIEQDKNKAIVKDAAVNNEKLAQSQIRLLQEEQRAEKEKQKLIQTELKRQKAVEKLTLEYQKQQLEQQKQIQALKAQALVQASSTNTEERATAIIKFLTLEKAKLNSATEDGKRKIEAYNRAIDIQRQKLLSTGSVIQKQAMNVGNYAYNTNGLTMSFNQLTREMPAFANSIQTGFMALSNNIPMFIDQVKAASTAIKTMNENGQKAPSMFRVMAGAIFSWQTAISAGVTLLAVFGEKIFDFFTGTKKETEEFVKTIKTANQEIIEEILKQKASRNKIDISDYYNINSKDIEALEKQIKSIESTINTISSVAEIPVSAAPFLDKIITNFEQIVFWEKELENSRAKGVRAYSGLTNEQFAAYLELRRLTFEHNEKVIELEQAKIKKEIKDKREKDKEIKDLHLNQLEEERDYQKSILDIQGKFALEQFDIVEKSEMNILAYKLKIGRINEKEYQTELNRLYKERADFIKKLESESLKSMSPKSGLKPTDTISTKATPYVADYSDYKIRQTMLERLGIDETTLSAIKTGYQELTSIMEQHYQHELDIANRRIENAERQVEDARDKIEREKNARDEGRAYNIRSAEKELADAKRIQKKALDEQKKVLQQQQALQSIEQATNLVTASAALIKNVGADKPYVYLPLLGAMWTAFINTKIKAAKETKELYSEGGTGMIGGGSHASGNDTFFGTTKSGKKRYAQVNERWAIFNDKATRIYGKDLENWINSINKGTFQGSSNMVLNYQISTHNLEKGVNKIVRNTEEKVYEVNGKTVIKRGNNTTYYV